MNTATIKNRKTFCEYDFDYDYVKHFLISNLKNKNGISDLIVSDVGDSIEKIIENLDKITSGKIYIYDINVIEELPKEWVTIIMQDLSKEKELVKKALKLITI